MIPASFSNQCCTKMALTGGSVKANKLQKAVGRLSGSQLDEIQATVSPGDRNALATIPLQ